MIYEYFEFQDGVQKYDFKLFYNKTITLILSTYYTICPSIVNTLDLAHNLDLTHLFKTISTHTIFFEVEVLFSI